MTPIMENVGYARKNVQEKIKRKPFEMSLV